MSWAISLPVAMLISSVPNWPIDVGLTSETFPPLERSTISVLTVRLTKETMRESKRCCWMFFRKTASGINSPTFCQLSLGPMTLVSVFFLAA